MTIIRERPQTQPLPESSNHRSRSRASWRLTALRRRQRGRRSAKARTPATLSAKILTWALLACSAVALWCVFFTLVLSSLQYSHNQHNLYAQFREQLALETAPLGATIAPDSPVALINIDSVGVHNQVVVEGTASGDLTKGPGHRRDTPLPGQAGTSVLFGRETLFGGVFGRIHSARPGDVITVTTAQGRFTYMVEDVRHVGDTYPPALADGAGRLVLATAEGAGWRSGWAPSRTVYVDAKLQGVSVPAPGGTLASIPKAEAAMTGDVSSLFSLVLWIPVLALAATAVVWSQDRWGRWQTWLAGTPVVAAALWGVTETAAQLLPNLM